MEPVPNAESIKPGDFHKRMKDVWQIKRHWTIWAYYDDEWHKEIDQKWSRGGSIKANIWTMPDPETGENIFALDLKSITAKAPAARSR